MATRLFRAGNFVETVTTRYLALNSSLATKIVLTSGYTVMRIFNSGSTPIVWGDSSISVNSGNYLFPYGSEEFGEVQDDFNFFAFSDSNGTTGLITITEIRR